MAGRWSEADERKLMLETLRKQVAEKREQAARENMALKEEKRVLLAQKAVIGNIVAQKRAQIAAIAEALTCPLCKNPYTVDGSHVPYTSHCHQPMCKACKDAHFKDCDGCEHRLEGHPNFILVKFMEKYND